MTFEDADQGALTMRSVGIIDFEHLLQSATMSSEGTGTQGEFLAQQTGTMRMISEGLTVYIEQLESLMNIDGFDIEAWLDDENRARRVKYTYDALPMPAMN